MDDSKLSSALVFFVGNYFVTFFIIGLIAAGISLLNKPKPLRIGEVSEAFISYICFSRLDNEAERHHRKICRCPADAAQK